MNDNENHLETLLCTSFLLMYLIALFLTIRAWFKLLKMSFEGYDVKMKDYIKVLVETFEVFGISWIGLVIINFIHIALGLFIWLTPINVVYEIIAFAFVGGMTLIYSWALYYSWRLAISSFLESRNS